MPPFLTLLAQDAEKTAAEPARKFDWFTPPTELFGIDFEYAPAVAIPAFLVALAIVSFLVERIAAWFVRRFAAKTETRIDDVFAAGLPAVVRLTLTFVALSVVAHALILTSEGATKATSALAAIGVIVVGIALTRLALRLTDAWAEDRVYRKPVGPGIKLGIKVIAIPILVVSALSAAGVQIAPLLTVLGVGSLAVALALQDILKNIFSGVQLVLDRPIRPGDFVVLEDGKVRGNVMEIGLRSTKVRTAENNVVIVPNAHIANVVVTNMDVLDKEYVHTMRIGVAYGVDTRRVQAILEEEADHVVAEHEAFVKEKPRVFLAEFADSALIFTVTLRLQQFTDRMIAMSELNHRIHERLRGEGIEIPFPTRTVYLRHETVPLPGGRPDDTVG